MQYFAATLIALYTLLGAFPANGEEPLKVYLTIYADDYPPLSYQLNGEATGLIVDLLLEIFDRLNMKKVRHDIVFAPWSRSYTETQRHKNTILFTAVRTPLRENLFKWVGPIGVSRQVLIARKDNRIVLPTSGNFNGYKYGVMKQSSGEQRLLAAGAAPRNFIYVNSPQSAARLLARGRYDAMAFDQTVAFWVLNSLGYNSSDFKVVYAFDELGYYYAFNKDR